MQLENGVILPVEVVIALEVLESPAELLSAIFTNPAEALLALSNIGSDMSPAVREEGQKAVVAAVVVGQIAMIRRKP